MIVLFIPSRSYCNGLGLDFTENNHSLSKLTLGWTVYCREKALQPKVTPPIIFRSGSLIMGLLLVCFLRRLHRSEKRALLFVFLCPFRSGECRVAESPGKRSTCACTTTYLKHLGSAIYLFGIFVPIFRFFSKHITYFLPPVCCCWDSAGSTPLQDIETVIHSWRVSS